MNGYSYLIVLERFFRRGRNGRHPRALIPINPKENTMKKLLLAATILAAGSGIALAHTVTAAPQTAPTAQAQQKTDGVQVARFWGRRDWGHRHHRHHRG